MSPLMFLQSSNEHMPWPKSEVRSGTDLLESYIGQRNLVAESTPKYDDERLAEIRQIIGARLEASGLIDNPDYNTIDPVVVANKWGWLADQVRELAPEVAEEEFLATDLLRKAAFSMYEETPETEKHIDADGSFAFMVPIRMDSEHPEYGEEVENTLPLFRFVPNELRAKLIVGMPPCIIDRYNMDEKSGKRGYLVFVPIYGDSAIDLKKSAPKSIIKEVLKLKLFPTPKRIRRFGRQLVRSAVDDAAEHISNAANFANRRLGADVVGLGAVLPALSNYGNRIKNEDVITTTGHGGTVHLIQETFDAVQNEKIGRAATEVQTIGVIGCGSIGSSIAHIMSESFLSDEKKKIIIFDTDKRKLQRTYDHLVSLGLSGRVEIAANEADILSDSQVVVSAITSTLDLSKMQRSDGSKPDFDGLVFIDDSQPGSMTLEAAKEHGIHLAWVIGEQYNGTESLQRENFDYGCMPSPKNVFGCEAEAWLLAARVEELRSEGLEWEDIKSRVSEIALSGPVDPEKVKPIAELARNYHIGAAALQAFGKLLEQNLPDAA